MDGLIEDLGPIRTRQHHVYDHKLGSPAMERLLRRLAEKSRLPHKFLQDVSARTRIPVPTLKQWRTNLLIDPSWRPRHGRPGKPRLLDREEEEELAKVIKEQFIAQSRYLSGERVRSMARSLWREHHNETESERQPAFSNSWKERFERSYGLSERVPHLQRRTNPRDDIVAHFLQEFEVVKQQFPKTLIFNADETCWRILNGKLRTVALTGSDSVHVSIGFDSKETVTVMACCSAAGVKLPLYAIVKGKTAECERSLRNDSRLRSYIGRVLYIGHTESGWATKQFQIDYLNFIEKTIEERYCCLLWDLHISHRSPEVVQWANEHKINILFIPAGQTGEYQPLDRRVFGVLKKQSHKLLLGELEDKDLTAIDRIDALVLLCKAWNGISENVIKRSWSNLFGDSVEEEEEIE